jgi:uncharacterized protein YdeI (YjbR/CyaY-like superfamily)
MDGMIITMIKKVTGISDGAVHKVPQDLKQTLITTPAVSTVWENITPLARNEWICWITSAKKDETRDRRIKIMLENLQKGKRRPCCWAGCTHR